MVERAGEHIRGKTEFFRGRCCGGRAGAGGGLRGAAAEPRAERCVPVKASDPSVEG